jgi:hypothetical protein
MKEQKQSLCGTVLNVCPKNFLTARARAPCFHVNPTRTKNNQKMPD